MVKKTQRLESKNPAFLAISHLDWFLPYGMPIWYAYLHMTLLSPMPRVNSMKELRNLEPDPFLEGFRASAIFDQDFSVWTRMPCIS